MKTVYSPEIEIGRILRGNYGSRQGEQNGAFFVLCPLTKTELKIIVGVGLGWDHVSVSTAKRCPSWKEMCWVKQQFFDPEETAVEYHPAESKYVNCHPNVLHLWRPHGIQFPMPPIECV